MQYRMNLKPDYENCHRMRFTDFSSRNVVVLCAFACRQRVAAQPPTRRRSVRAKLRVWR